MKRCRHVATTESLKTLALHLAVSTSMDILCNMNPAKQAASASLSNCWLLSRTDWEAVVFRWTANLCKKKHSGHKKVLLRGLHQQNVPPAMVSVSRTWPQKPSLVQEVLSRESSGQNRITGYSRNHNNNCYYHYDAILLLRIWFVTYVSCDCVSFLV